MPYDCVTTDDVNFQRFKSIRVDVYHRRWIDRLNWYPKEQARNYKRVDEIHFQSRRQYGDEHFAKYAARNRLNQRFVHNAPEEEVPLKMSQGLKDLDEWFEQKRLETYTVPATTNGIYGSGDGIIAPAIRSSVLS